MSYNPLMTIAPIAHIKTDFPEKFGTPRQSGLVPSLGVIEFEEEYRNEESVRGLSGFSHIWLIWGFSENEEGKWHPTVRPPRLGGNERVGVFATRSPFRPNALGLSSVRLVEIRKGPVLVVEAPDMVSGTPIYDIKPYVPYSDCHIDALSGFTDEERHFKRLEAVIDDELGKELGEACPVLKRVLEEDPRPAYHQDPERVYRMRFSAWDIAFRVEDGKAILLKASKAGDKEA